MDRSLDSLSVTFRPLAVEFLARCVEARLPVVIVNTRRTAAEQGDAIATGHSWVAHSKHEDGDAIDVVPLASYVLHGAQKAAWDGTDPVWAQLGALGERIGLRWGGRWAQRDLGHFERA